ncbi:MAG TPA: DUF3413 domain-containing protein [Coxiellaceae bacterium]|nr:DUF3413 domain-containing protein [Coxiellaceae bacterium]
MFSKKKNTGSQFIPVDKKSRKHLSHWAAWFFAANIVLYLLISLNYIPVIPNPMDIPIMTLTGATLSWFFLVISFLVQLAIFSFGACLIVVILTMLYPRHWLVFSISCVLGACIALFLIIDSVVYHLFHFHFAGVTWHLLTAGVITDVVILSSFEWLMLGLIIVGLLAIEVALATLIWRKKNSPSLAGYGRILAISLVVCLGASYSLMLRSSGVGTKLAINYASTHQIVMESQVIPFYSDCLGLFLPDHHGSLRLQTAGAGLFLQMKQIAKPLNYPLHPLNCPLPAKPYNIMFIVIDALRFDTMTAQITPNMAAFAKDSWQFENNTSGGNATGPGIFSMFYGLPYNYWTAMLAEQRGPVLIDQLLKDGYQMGVYRSASMEYPAFNKTVFSAIKNLQLNTKGSKAYERDRNSTDQFKQFLANRDPNKPFFGFLFYDAVHNYCQQQVTYPEIFQPIVSHCDRMSITSSTPVQPYKNRYYNAAHYDDSLVGEILNDLKNRNLLDNTIVILASDHGQEFNDSGQLYWGHASAYTQWQVKTPLIIHWPGQAPQVITHLTSHYDIVPLLMQKALGCTNPVNDYSVGQDIFVSGNRPYIIANSYIDYAIVQPERITRIYPQGNYVISDPRGPNLPEAKIDGETLKQAFNDIRRYFVRDAKFEAKE